MLNVTKRAGHSTFNIAHSTFNIPSSPIQPAKRAVYPSNEVSLEPVRPPRSALPHRSQHTRDKAPLGPHERSRDDRPRRGRHEAGTRRAGDAPPAHALPLLAAQAPLRLLGALP